MKLLIYDAEIIRAIPAREEPRLDGIEYCLSWGDKAGMGIAVICAYQMGGGFRVFLEDNFEAFKELAADPETLLIGHGNRSFDDPLIEACLGVRIPPERSWDLMRQVQRHQPPGKAHGPSLQALCVANFLPGKSGSGAFAPILWQRGKRGQVIDYCLNDVDQTVKLIELVIEHRLRDTDTGRVLPITLPTSIAATPT